jgi:hypothetical protein
VRPFIVRPPLAWRFAAPSNTDTPPATWTVPVEPLGTSSECLGTLDQAIAMCAAGQTEPSWSPKRVVAHLRIGGEAIGGRRRRGQPWRWSRGAAHLSLSDESAPWHRGRPAVIAVTDRLTSIAQPEGAKPAPSTSTRNTEPSRWPLSGLGRYARYLCTPR